MSADLYFKSKIQAERVSDFKKLSLDEQLAFINEYNEKHKTKYTYGKFKAALDYGSVEI